MENLLAQQAAATTVLTGLSSAFRLTSARTPSPISHHSGTEASVHNCSGSTKSFVTSYPTPPVNTRKIPCEQGTLNHQSRTTGYNNAIEKNEGKLFPTTKMTPNNLPLYQSLMNASILALSSMPQPVKEQAFPNFPGYVHPEAKSNPVNHFTRDTTNSTEMSRTSSPLGGNPILPEPRSFIPRLVYDRLDRYIKMNVEQTTKLNTTHMWPLFLQHVANKQSKLDEQSPLLRNASVYGDRCLVNDEPRMTKSHPEESSTKEQTSSLHTCFGLPPGDQYYRLFLHTLSSLTSNFPFSFPNADTQCPNNKYVPGHVPSPDLFKVGLKVGRSDGDPLDLGCMVNNHSKLTHSVCSSSTSPSSPIISPAVNQEPMDLGTIT
ncbi:hypothetical protein T265_01095 [Opisthorchis viverrini]|uniref:Uncharacterized protein n=1 Tax=Opisthorchis viverrini TaxID=6198 RepID=A0A075AB22_OPIVI|nr:hypothetical protein T265_01095 [Opisthorchis viverrini]KER33015.1 hypothetical protein T265_01095 [Opisthorchis viverrini]